MLRSVVLELLFLDVTPDVDVDGAFEVLDRLLEVLVLLAIF